MQHCIHQDVLAGSIFTTIFLLSPGVAGGFLRWPADGSVHLAVGSPSSLALAESIRDDNGCPSVSWSLTVTTDSPGDRYVGGRLSLRIPQASVAVMNRRPSGLPKSITDSRKADGIGFFFMFLLSLFLFDTIKLMLS